MFAAAEMILGWWETQGAVSLCDGRSREQHSGVKWVKHAVGTCGGGGVGNVVHLLLNNWSVLQMVLLVLQLTLPGWSTHCEAYN